jgi:TonB family protein
MVHAFVSSQAVRFGVTRLGVASFSVITHASLITLAVVASGPRATIASSPRVIPAEQLHFIRMPVREASSALAGSRAVAPSVKRADRLVVPDMSRLRVVADASFAALPQVTELTEADLSSRLTDQHDFADADTHSLVGGSAMWALTHPGRDGAYTQDVVERVAWPQRDNPRPRYPNDLQRAGIEGSFVVQFVVDSTGRVDGKTLSFPTDAQPGFLRAVKDALLRSRFFPAELAGMRVRQLVQQQFTFVIAR